MSVKGQPPNPDAAAPAELPLGGPKDAAPLEFRNVTKRYPGTDRATLDDISFELPAGEICVLVGPSGCGKTTAMRMINRMVEITDGDILLEGRSVRERNPAELRREIGYVIQQVGLFPHLTIGENIGTVPRLLGWEKGRLGARVDELRELIGLPPETLERYPAQLSGGQRQRVGVARALAADPPLMLMDEPFGAIDPITRNRLQDEFLRLQLELRKTIVFVTHDIDEAIKMGDRIAIFDEHGKLAQYDVPDEILARPANEFVARFVGVDRGLKRLTLSRLADVELAPAHCVRSAADVPGGAEPWTVVLVDDELLPTDRLGPDGRRVPLDPTATLETSLRDALSLILSDSNRPLVTLGADGAVAGLARLEVIAAELGGYEDASAQSADGQPEEHR